MIVAYRQPHHMGPFNTQNKNSGNPIALLNLLVHHFSLCEKCKRPNLSGEAGNAFNSP